MKTTMTSMVIVKPTSVTMKQLIDETAQKAT